MWREEILCGNQIVGAKVKSPQVWLEVAGGGWIEVEVEGDCCSDAFIDAVRLERFPTLSGKTQEISFSAKPTTQEVDEVTAVKFEGEGGCLSIVHRNSSNGYYGNYVSITNRGTPPADAVDAKSWYRDVTADGN